MKPVTSGIPADYEAHSSAEREKNGWSSCRASEKPEDRMLNLEAVAWIDGLPTEVRPHALAERYPRICNRMVERWPRPEVMIPYFDDLLMDSRGGRQGFPLAIAIEIVSLKEYFISTLKQSSSDVWGRNAASREF